jgi:flagellar assembly protein FliH
MSRLLRLNIAEAASLGSFVVRRAEGGFRPHLVENDDFPLDDREEPADLEAGAYARGYEDARATVEAEFAAERDALVRLAESLEVLQPQPANALALLLAETVDRLVREVVGEVEIDPIALLARAKAAAELVAREAQPSKLHAHPDDLVHLEQARLDIAFEADPSLPRGTIVLETGEGWIEDGPAIRLERLRAELDLMAAPR